jgi:hypothetical protein
MNGLLSPDDMMMRGAQGTPNNSDALMQSLYGLGDYADAGMILPFAITPQGERVLSFPAPIQSVARTVARGMGGMPLETDPYTGMLSENVLADAAEAAGLFTGAGLLAPKPAGAIGMSGGGGGVTRTIPPRQVDDLGFYSQALEAAARLPQAKGTGQQMEKMLINAGVKPDEIAFTPGLRGLLDQPQVTREELVGLLQEKQIRPQETVLEGGDIFGESQLRFGEPEIMEPDYDYDISGRVDDLMYMFDPDDIKSALIGAGFDEDYASNLAFRANNENFPNEMTSWADRLSHTEQKEIESAFADQAKAEYYEEPRFVWRDQDTDYEIRGNDNFGYEVYGPSGAPIRGEAWSLNEARALATNAAYDAGDIGVGRAGEARFGEEGWVEEGGTNYRENLLQIPEYEGMTGYFYEKGHFDEPNIAVHSRTKDRNTESGVNDVLYVEELQSDWGQQGRKYGFDTPKDREKLAQIKKQVEPIQQKLNNAVDERDAFYRDFMNKIAKKVGGVKITNDEFDKDYAMAGLAIKAKDGSELLSRREVNALMRGTDQVALTADGRELPIDPSNFDGVDIATKMGDLDFRIRSARDELDNTRGEFRADIPIGPLVGNSEKFAEAGIKRLLIQAANEGKRYVSFSPGDLQADRWNNPGLEVYYDEIIPKVAKKVAKRFDKDAFIGNKYVEELGDRFTIEITPKMRAAIQEGVPLFVTGGQGLLAAGEGMRQQPQQGILY